MKVLRPVGILLERMMTVLFYKLEENKMSILEVTDRMRIDSDTLNRDYFAGKKSKKILNFQRVTYFFTRGIVKK